MIVDELGDGRSFESLFLGLLVFAFHFTVKAVAHQFEHDINITEDGTYDSKEEVAAYISTYHKLPSNYITKGEAKALGWHGGSVEKYAPGKCIGGDIFTNRQSILPITHEYRECDIDTLGASSRGPKRIVYSTDDFEVYYTGDHYASFEHLT